MIDIKSLEKIECILNGRPCRFCGRTHKVRLTVLSPGQREERMKVDVEIPRGDQIIGITLDDGACIQAQTEVTMIVSQLTAGW